MRKTFANLFFLGTVGLGSMVIGMTSCSKDEESLKASDLSASIVEKTIWEGTSDTVRWGENTKVFDELKDTWAEKGIGVGVIVVAYVETLPISARRYDYEGADWAITTMSWCKINSGEHWNNVDGTLKNTTEPSVQNTKPLTETPRIETAEYLITTTKFLKEQGGFAVVGNNVIVKRIAIRYASIEHK